MTCSLGPLRDALWGLAAASRWFSGRTRDGHLDGMELTEWFQPPAGHTPGLRSAILHVSYPTGEPERYHVPLACYSPGTCPSRPLARFTWDGESFDALEATGNEAALAVLLGCLQRQRPGFERLREIPSGLTGRRYLGEQSNTSIFYGDQIVGKFFRRLEEGVNLDVELHRVLAGSGAVAELYGTWSWQGADLGIFLEALPEPRDGYVEACRAAAARRSFSDDAQQLGRQLAVVHRLLAERLPTTVLPGEDVATDFKRHLEEAADEVPELARYRPAILSRYQALEGLRFPAQRIHGDCHLGQALLTGDGWRYVDFEGEPLKPLRERRALDSPWRDVAGMLRSLHYAASEGDSPQGWLDETRDALLDGYGPADASALTLLEAYETDKAIYETIYETRMRPHLLHVPLGFLAAQDQR